MSNMDATNVAMKILDDAIEEGHPHTKEDLDKVKADVWAHGVRYAADKWTHSIHPLNEISREAIFQLFLLGRMAS